jgi:Cd2+/Zn2+-exporting ATPase
MHQKVTHTARHPIVFDEFFNLGFDESVSPFISHSSRSWAINLSLKASILAAIFLLCAFILSWIPSMVPISYLLITAVYFFAGIPSLILAIQDISRLQINIDVLMTLAAFSSVLIGSSMEGALLLVLFSLSGSMEDAVTAKAKGAISTLHKLSPTKACVVDEDGKVLEKAIYDIGIDTNILVRAGEIVPLDGIVINGISSVNLVHLTGENLPVTKKVGDEVAAGARNLEGAITLRVIRTSADSTLAHIIRLVTQAQEARPTLQRWFDRLSERYAMTIILLALLTALSFPYFLNIPFLGVEGSVYRSLAFLIAASPCALIIAIPIAYLSAVSICAKQGVLLKGGITLDALASCSIIAFDKTGTLTTGELTCTSIEVLNKSEQHNMSQALSIAAALERNVVHPIAKAILTRAEEKGLDFFPIENFISIPGYGLEADAQIGGKKVRVYIGRPEYIVDKLSASIKQPLNRMIEQIKEEGELLTTLLIGNQLYCLRFRDMIRPGMRETIADLKRTKKWRLLMLTGDHGASARKVANQLGIDEYYADLSPEDKLKSVSELSLKEGLAMVGDGINDAPALARATVGICMGKVGSATAIEAADAILLHDNLDLLSWLMEKAKKTQVIVKENLIIATVAIAVAAIPALAGLVPLWLAVILHEGGTVIVGLNALRLLKAKG